MCEESIEEKRLSGKAESQIDLYSEHIWLKLTFMQKKRKFLFIDNYKDTISYINEAQKVVSKWKSKKD